MVHSTLFTKRQFRKKYAPVTVAISSILLIILSGLTLLRTTFSHQNAFAHPLRSPIRHSFNFETKPAKGKFLVADRNLLDRNFSKTVILLTDYHQNGATGLIINRPTELKLSKAFPEMEKLRHRTDILYFGGPVAKGHMHLLIRSEDQPEGSRRVFDKIFVSSSHAVLQKMIDNAAGGATFRVYAGYAGWSPGQLDRELSRGDWHVLQADAKTIFDKPSSEIWPELIIRSSGKWTKAEVPGRHGKESRYK